MPRIELHALMLILVLAPAAVSAHDNGKYYGKNSGKYGKGYQSYSSSKGPVISFSRSYGPVTSFGLRNYFGTRNNDLYNRRYSYDNNFNSYLRNRALRERRGNRPGIRFGYTVPERSGQHNNQGRERDSRRTSPGIFSFGSPD